MPMIKPTCVRDLRSRVNIVDVVSRVATLQKAGSRFKGLCPFHNEKSPSFHVNPDMGVYKCFGCGKSGDIITFVRETEGLNFNEAVEALGQRFAVPIEYEDGAGPTREERSLRQELFDLHEVAAEHYHQLFKARGPAGDWMRAYWQDKRRFALELADEFKIGVAEPGDNSLGALLLKRKFSEDALRQCGLFFLREGSILSLGSLKPRFRGRLMIPIRDHQGRVVAFTARQTDLTPADDPAREAKYVNSPETPIFTKGNLLFNLDRARTQVGEGKPFVMVEGQLDALRAWSVGLKTAIAPQGTSITDGQLAMLRRYHTQVECFFDGDSAGQKASLRFLPMALKLGLEIRFLTLNGADKIDPDLLFLERGIAGYEDVRLSARSAMAFLCRTVLPNPGTASPAEKATAMATVRDIVNQTSSHVARMEYFKEAERHMALPGGALNMDTKVMEGIAVPSPHQLSRNEPTDSLLIGHVSKAATFTPEHDLLLICLYFENLGRAISHITPHNWIDANQIAGALLNRFLAELEQGTWPGRQNLDSLLESDAERELVASLLFSQPSFDDPKKVAIEGLQQIRTRALEPRLREIELALANHRTDSKVDPFSLLKERSDLQRQLRQPLVLTDAA